MSKIYTRTGDGGDTGLFTGARIGKDDPRMAAIGDVDELVAALGVARADAKGELAATLAEIQTELYCALVELASPGVASGESGVGLAEDAPARLEELIDRINAGLPPLTDFVMPGAARLSAQLHMARTVCRRAERAVVGLGRDTEVPVHVQTYLNRLSDALFVLARWADHAAGRGETTFKSTL